MQVLVTAWLVLNLCFGLVVAKPWPKGPFRTSGRWIVNSDNENVKLAGVNWPAHGETMIPEGLQYRSVEQIVSQITSVGMNAIRLTFAIQMVDQIFANCGKDISLEQAFFRGLGTENGTRILEQVLEHNPSFTASTTRFEVFDAIAAECERQHVYIHLDNHMSTGKWCCNGNDGNAWWGDSEFDTDKWVRGLAYIAEHGKRWPALISLALRNEVRRELDQPELYDAYSWQNWYKFMRLGSDAVHKANEDLIIVFGGIEYGHVITPVFRLDPLTPGVEKFERSNLVGYGKDKVVLEFHNYDHQTVDAEVLRRTLYNDGFQGMNETDPQTKEVYPVMLTEFGHHMSGADYERARIFDELLTEYLPKLQAMWFHWVIVGEYYARRGAQADEEQWGLLNRNWTAWRNPNFIKDHLIPRVKGTLATPENIIFQHSMLKMPVIETIIVVAVLSLGVLADTDISAACAADIEIAAIQARSSAAACGTEGNKNGLSCLRPVGHFEGATSASECSSMCQSEPYDGLCQSFSYSPDAGTCVFWDTPFSVGGQDVPDTGVFFWDTACWANEPACPVSNIPAPPTTSSNLSSPLCKVRSIHPEYESFSTYRRGTSAEQCFDICNDCWRAPRCKSFIWGTETDGCYFYDIPAEQVKSPSNGVYDIFVWDKACFTSTTQ
ncbi:Glycosyl hydrolase 5 family protein [Paramyrothecium foliicola]|nr:Glycosyl hydrolase 5 family protein [Paramyrothecium foliicola]